MNKNAINFPNHSLLVIKRIKHGYFHSFLASLGIEKCHIYISIQFVLTRFENVPPDLEMCDDDAQGC